MENILEGNKLIAEFMGLRIDSFPQGLSDSWYVDISNPESIYNGMSPREAKFNSSWDWLMPVVEKIESSGGAIHIDEGVTFLHFPVETATKMKRYNYGQSEDYKSKIECVYTAVIQFIQWYNLQNNHPKI